MARTIGKKNILNIKSWVKHFKGTGVTGINEITKLVMEALPSQVFDTWEGAYSEIEQIIADEVMSYHRNPRKQDITGMIMAFESGELSGEDTLKLFAHLIKTGLAWQLQGSIYGRPAKQLIEQGYISPEGKILRQLANNPMKVSEEFKVGDIIDTQGHSNVKGMATIREIKGYSLYLTDEKGTNFSGISRSTVRNLIKAGRWKKITNNPRRVKKLLKSGYVQNKPIMSKAKIRRALLEVVNKLPVTHQVAEQFASYVPAGEASRIIKDLKSEISKAIPRGIIKNEREYQRLHKYFTDVLMGFIKSKMGYTKSKKKYHSNPRRKVLHFEHRGTHFVISLNKKYYGEVIEYGQHKFPLPHRDWRILGFSKHHWSSRPTISVKDAERDPKVIIGTLVWDVDHNTVRQWGGRRVTGAWKE